MLVFIGDRGLCPVCGEPITLVNSTTDGRLIGSCGDAFLLRQWAQEQEPLYVERTTGEQL